MPFRAQMAEIEELHRKHRLFARLALGDRRSAMKQLKMSGKQKTDMMSRLDNLKTFYLMIEIYTDQMENFRIAPEELAQTKAMVDAAHSLYQDRIHGRGDAQHATQQRDKKRRELRQWMAQFKRPRGWPCTTNPNSWRCSACRCVASGCRRKVNVLRNGRGFSSE